MGQGGVVSLFLFVAVTYINHIIIKCVNNVLTLEKQKIQFTGVSVGQQGKRIRDGIAAKHLAQASRTPGRVSPCRATHREGPGKPGDPNLRRPEVREGLTPQPASAGKGLNILHAHGTATLTR